MDNVLARIKNVENKSDSQPRVDDSIVKAVNEIHHELNTDMEFLSDASAQRVGNIDVDNQSDHISGQGLADDEKGPSHPEASKATRNKQTKMSPTSASRSYYYNDRLPVTQNNGRRIPKYHQPDNSSYNED